MSHIPYPNEHAALSKARRTKAAVLVHHLDRDLRVVFGSIKSAAQALGAEYMHLYSGMGRARHFGGWRALPPLPRSAVRGLTRPQAGLCAARARRARGGGLAAGQD